MKSFIIPFLFLSAVGLIFGKKPNIVFFFTDDQTSSVLGCYGHPLAKTPNIDKLASEGTRFANAFVSQSHLLGEPDDNFNRIDWSRITECTVRNHTYGKARSC